MRYLGIDYGKKRIGLALSDQEGRLAFPHSVVGRIGDVVAVIHGEGVWALVIGLPLTLSGQESGEARAVRAFAGALRERVELPIAFESEVFTTKIAERSSAGAKADASAAALILQSYLDKKIENRK